MASPWLRWLHRWLLVFGLLGAAGCDWTEDVGDEPRPRGANLDEPAPSEVSAAESARPALPPVVEPPPEARRPQLGDRQPSDQAPAVAPAGDEESPRPEEGDQTPERDLSSELRALVGDPSACLSGLEGSSPEVTLRVRASTSVTGIITRSSVSGADLGEEARECVRRRLEGSRFRSPVPDAPRDVTAELTLRRQSPAPRPDETEEDDRQKAGAWRHGIFYPGGAPSEPEED